MADTLAFPVRHYLNDGYGVKSWLLTRDHKRIALLYLAAITVFFFIGGAFAVIIRLELATPAGDLVSDETYNKLFTMHGVMMVFFFLIPSIPATLGNFLIPIMIGAKDLAFPKLNLASWYIYVLGGLFTLYALIAGGVDTGWTFYTPFSTVSSTTSVIPDGLRHLHHGILLNPHGHQFHRDDPHHASSGYDVVPDAIVPLVDVCDQHDLRARDAGAGDYDAAGRG